ncbi:hypothetical protein [Streptomyces atriruber]|uniref:hypothetical protein n=1 Tax=Streptomyces atriruber TaxID=545121 RepID=UPI0006E1C32F|nr:hypothetical protein [Streptomyces atriruber]
MANRGRILKITAALTLTSLALTGFTTGRGHGGGSRHGGGGGGGGGCSNSSQDHDSSSSSSSGSSGSGSSGSGSSGSTSSGSGYDDDDDVYGSSSGGRDGDSGGTRRRLPNDRSSASSSPEGRRTEDGKAKLVRCATKAAPYATVKVTNSNAEAGRFWVSVTFVDAEGITIIEQSEKVRVPANGKATARVEIGGGGLVDSLDHCEVDPQALPVSG